MFIGPGWAVRVSISLLVRVCVWCHLGECGGGKFLLIRVMGFVHFLLFLPPHYFPYVSHRVWPVFIFHILFYPVWVCWACVLCCCVGLMGKVTFLIHISYC